MIADAYLVICKTLSISPLCLSVICNKGLKSFLHADRVKVLAETVKYGEDLMRWNVNNYKEVESKHDAHTTLAPCFKDDDINEIDDYDHDNNNSNK